MTDARIRRPSLINLRREIIEGKLIDTLMRTAIEYAGAERGLLNLQEREARIRRLVDSNIIGIFVWDLGGRIIDANEAFLRIIGYGRDDLVSGRLRWRDLTPTEWRDADDRRVAALEATGTAQPYEKEYLLKSGGRVPVLVGAATFGGRRDQGMAFVVDLTERKRAEEEIRESERRYSDADGARACESSRIYRAAFRFDCP
jgi:PAS domain S-box-containing protein